MFFKLALVSCVLAVAVAQYGHGHGGGYGHGGGSSYSSVSLGGSHYGASSAHNLGHGIALGHAAPIIAAPIHAVPIIAAAPAYGHGAAYGHEHQDYYAHPQYQFHYGVSDAHTGDQKQQQEHRDGDQVHGEYSLHQPDGTVRTVKYQADDKNGFNAQVIISGHAAHPASHAPVYGHGAAYGHY